MSITFHTCIFSMLTVMRLPSSVSAIPKVAFIARTRNIIQQYGSTTLAIVSQMHYDLRPSEAQLMTGDVTIFNIPPIITNCTPTKCWMKNLHSSTIVVLRTTQSDLKWRVFCERWRKLQIKKKNMSCTYCRIKVYLGKNKKRNIREFMMHDAPRSAL